MNFNTYEKIARSEPDEQGKNEFVNVITPDGGVIRFSVEDLIQLAEFAVDFHSRAMQAESEALKYRARCIDLENRLKGNVGYSVFNFRSGKSK